jgi:hypothetical protein
MRKSYALLLTLLIHASVIPVSPLFPTTSSPQRDRGLSWEFETTDELREFAYVDGDSAELIIGVDDLLPADHVTLMEMMRKYRAAVVNRVTLMRDVEEAIIVDVPLSLVVPFASDLQNSNIPSYVEPNFRFRAQFMPNDPYWGVQWGPARIEANLAWNLTAGSSSVLVAVVDTGINWRHADLAANYVPLGFDWVNDDADPSDDHGHGSHVAGIIGAAINNNVGIAGVAQVSIMAEKGLNFRGEGYADDLASAIAHATEQGADVISMSWGDYVDSRLIRRAIVDAYNAGVLLVAAAGNDATNEKSYPAAYDEVIAVTATDRFDNHASFSNFGSWIELSAPGVSIYSTLLNGGFGYKSGTSMAAPHVSGVAALVWSVYPYKTRDELRLWLRNASDDLDEVGFDPYYGYGRINARKAVGSPERNIVIAKISLEKAFVGQGFAAEVYVHVANQGIAAERFNVTFCLDEIPVETKNTTAAGISTNSLTFRWDTTSFGKGNYTVGAYADPLTVEINTTDNVLVDGWIFLTIPGDMDGDRDVDIFDVVSTAYAYGTREGDSQYVPDYDIDGDGTIDLLDMVTIAGNYGQTDL